MDRIIYQSEEGGVSVIIPEPDSGLTFEQVAAKDVPNVPQQAGFPESVVWPERPA